MEIPDFLTCSQGIQNCYDSLSAIPLIRTSAHFVISSFIAFLGFHIFLTGGDDKAETIKQFKLILNDYKNYYQAFLLMYTLFTGMLVTAIIDIQHNGQINIPISVVYGCLGPYFLKNKMLGGVSEKVSSMLQKEANEIKEDKEAPYKKSLEKIKKDEYQDFLKELKNIIPSS